MYQTKFLTIKCGRAYYSVDPAVMSFRNRQAQKGKIYNRIEDLIADFIQAGKPGFQDCLFNPQPLFKLSEYVTI